MISSYLLGGDIVSVDAISRVKSAEKEAELLVEEAKKEAKSIIEDGKKEAFSQYKAIVDEANEERNKEVVKAEKEGERLANPILEAAKHEADSIKSISDKELNSA